MTDISTQQQARLNQLVQEYALNFLIMFGSQARGQARPDSDTDIGYHAARNLSLQDEEELSVELEKVFKKEIDVRSLRSENPYFLYSALLFAKFLAGNPTKFAHLQAFSFQLYNDAQYDIEPIRQAFLRKRLKSV